ncbi:uncharacterized protein LOC131648745 [Vicia villosa]|uniref:uncharacterized protein LOC131648745 n=1 Tax=Vicia villosa TaxID=3911 RepID=UPI00273B3FE3|nr:uncharacterized protein LOC131648745 [Vicia villosa]
MTIVNQPVNVAHFQLHPTTIRQLEKKPFSGRINEDANKHLQRFITMTTSLKIEGHSEEAKKLVVFPFTLSDDAEEWFYSLPARSITTWQQMETTFLNECFPASVYIRKRYDINFVNGLKLKTKQLIDTVAGGSTNFKTATEIKKIIDAIAANEHLELYDRSVNQPEGLVDLKLSNQVVKMEDQIAAEVECRLKQMALEKQTVAQIQPAQPIQAMNCEICGGPHFTVHCVQPQQQFQQQGPRKADWEIAIEKIAAQSSQFQEETRSNFRNTGASIKDLEIQMSQIAQQLASPQQPGALPSATVTNPKDHNNVSAIVTRSGKAKEVVEESAEEEEPLL